MRIWIDGRVREPAEATISVLDHGLLYGDGVFEGMRVYGRAVFRLGDHLDRLDQSARGIALALPMTREAIRDVVLETARAFARDDAYLRLVVTRGAGALGVDPTTCRKPAIFCIAADVELYPAEKRARGLDLLTASLRKPAPDVLDPRVKSLNYLNSVLAKAEARARGADEALVLNAAGTVAEASVANVFVFRHGVLSTPPSTDGGLEGITRASVLQLAEGLGIPTAITTLTRADLFAADEVFLTGTGARIVGVRSLDGREIGQGTLGGLAAKLDVAFREWAPTQGTAFE